METKMTSIDMDAMRKDAQAAVDAATPRGWTSQMLKSPWPEEQCPACGSYIRVSNMAIAVLTKKLNRFRVILFTLSVVCEPCLSNRHRLDTLAEITFE